jgi:hypothetical protein
MSVHRLRPPSKLALALALLATSAFAAACSSKSEPMMPDEPATQASASAEEPPAPKLPPGTVARGSVDQLLLKGPAFMLGKIETEEVLRSNKFIGWRLVSFPADWDTTGLQPGDIVTDVNGVALEKPDDLWDLWVKLADAPEIKINVERDGKPASTVVKIQGDPVATTKGALADGNGPIPEHAPKKATTGRRDTIVITGDDDDPSRFPQY